MSETQVAAVFVVRGRVQGVGFRAATRREALRLGLEGHAVNLPDGRVEVLAQGVSASVAALADWLARGPVLARVDAVECREEAVQPRAGFGIG